MNTLSQNVYDLISKDFSNLTLDINGHYLLIDTGANLINRKFSRDLESILKRAEDVGEYRKYYSFAEQKLNVFIPLF